jgi:hypothetical protein
MGQYAAAAAPVDLDVVMRFWDDGFLYLGRAADLGIAGPPTEEQQAQHRRARRRRTLEELASEAGSPVFRSFRLVPEGHVYAEAQSWAIDADALPTDAATPGSAAIAQGRRRSARYQVEAKRSSPYAANDTAAWRESPGPARVRRRARRALLQTSTDARYTVSSTLYYPSNAVVRVCACASAGPVCVRDASGARQSHSM